MNVCLGKRSATRIIQNPIFYCVLNVCTAPLGICGTCKEWRDLLCPDPLQQVNQQLSANRNARHQLELDLENKLSALSIDHTAHNLHNNSRCSKNTLECWHMQRRSGMSSLLVSYFQVGCCRFINLHGGIERVDATRSIPETWASFSQNNILHSQGA